MRTAQAVSTNVVTVTDGLPDGVTGIVCYEGGMNIDADGAPNAYCPQGGGLDDIRNAGGPGNWYIETDTGEKDGEPFVQGAGDPCPGCLVASTALHDPSKKRSDPTRYVDASSIAYISVPRELKRLLGCLCVVLHQSFIGLGLVAEVGGAGKYGEASIMMAETVNVDSSPIDGGVRHGVTYVIFEGTSKGWPRDQDEIRASAQALFDAWGGVAKLAQVLGPNA